MWIAVRAWGERQEPRDMIVAHSAPIYVVVDDEPTWKREAVPELIAYQRAQLQELLSAPIDAQQDLETWETSTTLVERCGSSSPSSRPVWTRPTCVSEPIGAVRAIRGRWRRNLP